MRARLPFAGQSAQAKSFLDHIILHKLKRAWRVKLGVIFSDAMLAIKGFHAQLLHGRCTKFGRGSLGDTMINELSLN